MNILSPKKWFFPFLLFPLFLQAAPPFLVVIDPGHGGSDRGAVVKEGKKEITEKEVTLALAQDVSRELVKHQIQSVLTRRVDQDVALPDRTALANRLKADVFISIHMNAAVGERSGLAEGIETYILNTSTDRSSKRLADLENSVLKGSLARQFENEDVSLIVKDLILDANLVESKHLACNVQSQMVKTHTELQESKAASRRHNRGVKQALFYVLLGADMPSVLVEAGFIDSVRDRALVQDATSRQRLAASIAEAIAAYRIRRQTPDAAFTLSKCLVR